VAANPNIVKVVTDAEGFALYFSRAPIPYPRDGGEAPWRRHVGIYGYQRDALQRLAGLSSTPLERAESLEQLRALENGMAIRVLEVEEAWPGVDTMDDLEAVERLLAEAATRG
jgi:3-deoxy-manno-octulosonate cytidylyltransferase (CMP-KDO synthetase)